MKSGMSFWERLSDLGRDISSKIQKDNGNTDEESTNQGPFTSYIKWIVGVLLIIPLWTSWYTVGQEYNAVIKTLGVYTGITTSGFHFKLPWPIQKVTNVNVQEIKRIEIGFRTASLDPIKYQNILEESLMLTSDYNIADVHLVIQYQKTDPARWLFSAQKAESVLIYLANACVRKIVGKNGFNLILTNGKVNIQTQIKTMLAQLVEREKIGVKILSAQLQDAMPPEKVIPAYNSVNAAEQDREKAKNEAWAYWNQQVPNAEGLALQALNDATGQKESRINNARGDVAVFSALLQKFNENPQLIQQRLRFEAIQEILKGKPQLLDFSNGGTTKLMDIYGNPLFTPTK